MDFCIEYINRQTYRYQYTYSLPHSCGSGDGSLTHFWLTVVSGTGAWVKCPNHLSHRLSSIITDGCHAVFYTIFRDGFGNLNIS